MLTPTSEQLNLVLRVSIPLVTGLHADRIEAHNDGKVAVSIPLITGLHADRHERNPDDSCRRLNPFDYRASC